MRSPRRSALAVLGAAGLLALSALPLAAQELPAPAQAYLGHWRVMDDETGEPKAVMELYEHEGEVFGRVVRSLSERAVPGQPVVCRDCRGEFANADLRETPILRHLAWDGDSLEGGRILDPRSGRAYRCSLELQDDGRLRVRGYVGIRAIGRTQVWERVR